MYSLESPYLLCVLNTSSAFIMNGTPPHLNTLVATIQPRLHEEEYVFCTINREHLTALHSQPLFQFHEAEGLTVVLRQEDAARERIEGHFPSKMIQINASANAVAAGFFAVIATRLAAHGLAIQPVAAFHHQYLFVPSARAQECLHLLEDLEDEYRPEEVIQQGSRILM